ncbi:hypothetical protein Tco_1018206 [Tanacetum coccineum]|uniref:Uncharacterized protein n=1 Tax=Tanacetum coccineum TaxID=301880 RepID=A0ABQ5FTN2_9ASTR
MLAPGNYVQWKSRIKRYIDTKPNNELIHYCLQNLPYKFKWAERTIPIAEGSSETTTEGYIENYKNVSQHKRNQLDAEAESVQIILIGIDNDIYSTVDACPNACEMWKAIESLKQVNVQFLLQLQPEWQRSQQAATRNRGKAIVNSPLRTYDQESTMVAEDGEISKEKEIDKLMALISLSLKKIYKPTNNNLRTSSNTSRANQDNTPRINKETRYDNKRAFNVSGDRENVARECQKPKWAKDASYQKEKMLLCKQEEVGFQLNLEQPDWRDDTDDELEDQELEAHYLYMAQIQEVTPDATDNSGPIFDAEPLQNVQNDNNNYNVLANDSEHPEQLEYVNDKDEDLASEHDLLASLIEKLKCEINESKDHNKLFESSNKTLVNKLKSEIADFKNKKKCLESSNTHFKEANTELAKNNQLMFKDLKKLQVKLDRYHDVNYASKVEIDCAKAKGELISYKMSSEKSFNEYT